MYSLLSENGVIGIIEHWEYGLEVRLPEFTFMALGQLLSFFGSPFPYLKISTFFHRAIVRVEELSIIVVMCLLLHNLCPHFSDGGGLFTFLLCAFRRASL